MKGLMGFLVKAKLVEPAADSESGQPGETPVEVVASIPDASPSDVPASAPAEEAVVGDIQEAIPFEIIYQQAGLPPLLRGQLVAPLRAPDQPRTVPPQRQVRLLLARHPPPSQH